MRSRHNEIFRAVMRTGSLSKAAELLCVSLMDVQHVADAVLHVAELPLAANVRFMTIMASKMPFARRG
jgi:NADP-dependent 3-hydroxy acid dehydrogenase YdfG